MKFRSDLLTGRTASRHRNHFSFACPAQCRCSRANSRCQIEPGFHVKQAGGLEVMALSPTTSRAIFPISLMMMCVLDFSDNIEPRGLWCPSDGAFMRRHLCSVKARMTCARAKRPILLPGRFGRNPMRCQRAIGWVFRIKIGEGTRSRPVAHNLLIL